MLTATVTTVGLETGDLFCPQEDTYLWMGDRPTEHGEMVYSEGDCWLLAWHLYRLADRMDFAPEIYTLGARDQWCHVVVKIEDAYWDIFGPNEADKLERTWFHRLTRVDPKHLTSQERYMRFLDAGEVFSSGELMANKVAQRLLELLLSGNI